MSESDQTGDICAICLASIPSENEKERLQCGHSFCVACIGQWRKKAKRTCPMCRSKSDVLRLYRRHSEEDGIGAILMEQEYRSRYGDQFCEPTSIMFGTEIATVFFIPNTAFDDDMASFFKKFGYDVQDAKEEEQKSSVFKILDNIAVQENANAKILIRSNEGKQQMEEIVRKVRNETLERIYCDPRIALLTKNNPQSFSKRLFPLYCRMIEFETAYGEEACKRSTCCFSEYGLKDSPMATAISKNKIDNPALILDVYGDEWRRAAQKLPLSEVEHVLCSMQNVVGSRKEQNNDQMASMHENEARSIVLFNRVRHCYCTCCAKALPVENESVKTCKRCESAFYCSQECYETDFMSHVRYCCNANARRERGVREISLASNAHANQVPGAMSRGQHQFNAEEVEAALQLASNI